MVNVFIKIKAGTHFNTEVLLLPQNQTRKKYNIGKLYAMENYSELHCFISNLSSLMAIFFLYCLEIIAELMTYVENGFLKRIV